MYSLKDTIMFIFGFLWISVVPIWLCQVKTSCNIGPSNCTELSKHFTFNGGHPNELSRLKETLRFTLVDYIDVAQEVLTEVGYVKGPTCGCTEINRLKDLEDKWVLKMGTFYGEGHSTQGMRSSQKQDIIGGLLNPVKH